MTRQLVALLALLVATSACAQVRLAESGSHDPIREAIVGDALLTEGAYHALAEITDRFGARMVGTPGHTRSMDWVEAELARLGIVTRREAFSFPGWRRGEDAVRVLAPFERTLRASALGYSASAAPFEADLALYIREDSTRRDAYRGRVLLVPANVRLTAGEQRQLVDAFGVRGFLLINRVAGGQLLTRTANLTGDPAPAPMFVLTQEEGRWLRRQLEGGERVRVKLEVASRSEEMVGTNLVATLPGASSQKIVVGAHFDSWDLGQGAMDNGLGVAQLLEAARLLNRHSQGLEHTVELVWFDAEEMGLWGSRAYAERHVPRDGDTSVQVMLNLDMVGTPIGINAMGFEALLPVLEDATEALGAWRFTEPIANTPWLGSDHHPFIERGVPSITFNAPIDSEAVRYYHDFADTIDKIDRYELARASAIIALVTRSLASDVGADVRRLAPAETTAMLQQAGVEVSLRALGWWPFSPVWPGALPSE